MKKTRKVTILFGEEYDYTEKNTLEVYQDMCYVIYKNQGLEGLFEYLVAFLRELFPDTEPPFTKEDTKEERTLLDLCIEEYTFLYFVHSGNAFGYRDLSVAERLEVMKEDKLLHLLLLYKMEKYGKEILGSVGLELVGKVEQGYLVRDTDDTGVGTVH